MTTQDWIVLYFIIALAYMIYYGLRMDRMRGISEVNYLMVLVRTLLWPFYLMLLIGMFLNWVIELVEDLRMGWRMSDDT